MSYNGWAYNDWSYNDQSYNDYPHNECSYEYMPEEYSDGETYEEEPFDESVLTPKQKLQVDDLHQEHPELTREDIAAVIRLNLLSHRAALEGRHLTAEEIFEAHALKTVIDWTPPSQIEEEASENVVEEIVTNAENEEVVEEITRLLYGSDYEELSKKVETQQAHALEMVMNCIPPSQLEGTCNSTLEIDHFEEISLPCIEKEVSSSLLLVDKCLELPCVSQDKVDYSLVDSTNLEIDFIFSPNAFDPPTQMNINEHHGKYFSFVETCFNKFVNTNFNKHLVLLVWTIVFLLAQFVYCENRRRTKGPLAQPFDSCD